MLNLSSYLIYSIINSYSACTKYTIKHIETNEFIYPRSIKNLHDIKSVIPYGEESWSLFFGLPAVSDSVQSQFSLCEK